MLLNFMFIIYVIYFVDINNPDFEEYELQIIRLFMHESFPLMCKNYHYIYVNETIFFFTVGITIFYKRNGTVSARVARMPFEFSV